MCDHIRIDKIRNEVIRDKVEVTPIENKITNAKLRWFCHIQRSMDTPVRKCEMTDLPEYRRGRGRPKKNWNEVIRYDMNFVSLMEDMVQDKSGWTSRIKEANRM